MKIQRDWKGKRGFSIGSLVSPESKGGVWTYKFCPELLVEPNEDWEPGYLIFNGVGVVVDKKLQRIYYTTDFVESKGDWAEIKLKKPTHLDIWVYQIATPAGIVGWCSGIYSAFDKPREFW